MMAAAMDLAQKQGKIDDASAQIAAMRIVTDEHEIAEHGQTLRFIAESRRRRKATA